jgi:hypothetical protein
VTVATPFATATEQTELVNTVYVTGNPELAVAVIVNEAADMPRF